MEIYNFIFIILHTLLFEVFAKRYNYTFLNLQTYIFHILIKKVYE